MTFDELGLAEPLLRAVRDQGYTTPTPIQARAIPAVLGGGDLLAGAQTGTGKTAGFTLPMLQRLSQDPPLRDGRGRIAIRALILTPTRELAAQVEESVRTYGKYLKLTSMVMFGGVGMQPQIDRLARGVDILVATPGRLLDHYQQGTLDLSRVQFFVLDEADRMLDMGFIHDVRKVLAILPPKKQSLLFSATFSDEIKALADRLLDEPALIEVARRNAAADTVAQKVYPVGRDRKKELLAHLIREGDWHQVLVFTRMKHGANRLAEYLTKEGIGAMAIHGNKSQSARTRALAEFKSGQLPVLVATDIAARGIDIDQLPHVVNYELPNVPEDYVHRIGRTGRAGATGEAVSLVSVDEDIFLRDIERLIRREIPREVIPGFEPPADEKPEPIVLGRMTIGVGVRGRGGRPGSTPAQGRDGRGSRHGSGDGRAAPGRGGNHQDGRGKDARGKDPRRSDGRDGRGTDSRDGDGRRHADGRAAPRPQDGRGRGPAPAEAGQGSRRGSADQAARGPGGQGPRTGGQRPAPAQPASQPADPSRKPRGGRTTSRLLDR